MSHFVGTIFSLGQICWKFFVDSSQLMFLQLNAILLTFVTLNWLGWVENPLWASSQNIYSSDYPSALTVNAAINQLFQMLWVLTFWTLNWSGWVGVACGLESGLSDKASAMSDGETLGLQSPFFRQRIKIFPTWSGQSTRRKKFGAFKAFLVIYIVYPKQSYIYSLRVSSNPLVSQSVMGSWPLPIWIACLCHVVAFLVANPLCVSIVQKSIWRRFAKGSIWKLMTSSLHN